jgi:hypothetical protein
MNLHQPFPTTASPQQNERMILEGVDHYRVMEAMFEGVRVILSYRGEPYSPAYMQGISGAAFRISGICPCAPTCSTAMSPQDLVRLCGYEADALPLDGDGDEREQRLQVLLARVKDEVRAGRPVLLWHAFTSAEWDVVCGFDEDSHEFFGRGSYAGHAEYAHANELRTLTCLDICPALGALFIGAKVGALDPRLAEKQALQEAVRHACTVKQPTGESGWVFYEGLQCYERWVNDFKSDPARLRGMGDSYCLGIYRSTHRAAADFMHELAPKYPTATSCLELAALHFAAEADALDTCVPWLDWDAPEAPTNGRNERVAAALQTARDHYAQAIGQIKQALTLAFL